MSLPGIGKLMDRDHATVMSSLKTVEKRMMDNPLFRAEMEDMVKEIKES